MLQPSIIMRTDDTKPTSLRCLNHMYYTQHPATHYIFQGTKSKWKKAARRSSTWIRSDAIHARIKKGWRFFLSRLATETPFHLESFFQFFFQSIEITYHSRRKYDIIETKKYLIVFFIYKYANEFEKFVSLVCQRWSSSSLKCQHYNPFGKQR